MESVCVSASVRQCVTTLFLLQSATDIVNELIERAENAILNKQKKGGGQGGKQRKGPADGEVVWVVRVGGWLGGWLGGWVAVHIRVCLHLDFTCAHACMFHFHACKEIERERARAQVS